MLSEGDEKSALTDYTREYSPDPHSPTYNEINTQLRGSDPLTPAVARDVALIDRALAGHPLTEAVVVERGTGLGHITDDPLDMVNKVITEPSFMSTSLGSAAFGEEEAILHLRVPAGTPAAFVDFTFLTDHFGERELLLGRGVSYRVDKVIKFDGQWQVYGEVLP